MTTIIKCENCGSAVDPDSKLLDSVMPGRFYSFCTEGCRDYWKQTVKTASASRRDEPQIWGECPSCRSRYWYAQKANGKDGFRCWECKLFVTEKQMWVIV